MAGHARYTALLDACVLYPLAMTDALLSLADWIKLIAAAARVPPRNDPANNQFERPSAIGRMRFSMWLLSGGKSPSSMKRVNARHRPRL